MNKNNETNKSKHGGPRPNSGRPANPEELKTVAVSTRILKTTQDNIDAAAESSGMSRSAVVAKTLEKAFGK